MNDCINEQFGDTIQFNIMAKSIIHDSFKQSHGYEINNLFDF